MNKIKQLFYLGYWFFGARILGRKRPLQTVLFISDRCNLQCRHCAVYAKKDPNVMTYEQVRRHLRWTYSQGSRFVDFEGGEVMLWRDGDYTINDLVDLAHAEGFFSATITTNAQLPFPDMKADSIWVSLDGIGQYHEYMRGKGTFARLEQNIASARHRHLSVNMVVSAQNYTAVEDTIRYARDNSAIEMISINFYTPFPGSETSLVLDRDRRKEVIDKVIAMKREGYPVMNSVSGLKLMKDNKFKRRCWVTNFIYADGTHSGCAGEDIGICDQCGLCMAGEMHSVFSFRPDTILAAFRLRM